MGALPRQRHNVRSLGLIRCWASRDQDGMMRDTVELWSTEPVINERGAWNAGLIRIGNLQLPPDDRGEFQIVSPGNCVRVTIGNDWKVSE